MNNLLSVFGGGLFIIPLGFFLGAVWTLYRAYKASKSQPMEYDATGKLIPSKGGNVPIHKTTQFVYFSILLAAAIGSALLMISDK